MYIVVHPRGRRTNYICARVCVCVCVCVCQDSGKQQHLPEDCRGGHCSCADRRVDVDDLVLNERSKNGLLSLGHLCSESEHAGR